MNCRLCAELKPSKKQVDLQYDSEKRGEITQKLARINATTEFIDNKLPSTVCFECICTLNKCFDFVINIERAQSVLSDSNYLRNVKQEASDSEEDSDNEISEDVVKIKLEPANDSSDERKRLETPRKIKKSESLDSIPLSEVKRTWASYNWLCTFCETIYPTIDELLTHSMSVHSSCNPYRCTDCKIRKEGLDKFLIHVQRHKANQNLKYSCFKCLKEFKKIPLAQRHRIAHFKTDFNCNGCSNSFNSSEELKIHKDKYFKIRCPKSLPRLTTENDLTCTQCPKICKSRGGLTAHLLTHTERKQEHICEICGKGFAVKSNLIGHISVHNTDRPFKCQICQSGFKSNRLLRNHVATHDSNKPYACDQCGRCFRIKRHLDNHSIIHTDLRPYQCPYCQKSFRHRPVFTNHLRLHTGIKPYSCEACPREFSNWSNYSKHMKRKHNHIASKKKHPEEFGSQSDALEVMEWKREILRNHRRVRASKTDPSSKIVKLHKTENIDGT